MSFDRLPRRRREFVRGHRRRMFNPKNGAWYRVRVRRYGRIR